jgi:predicted metal-dependent HD superfamily phosphohydrolase
MGQNIEILKKTEEFVFELFKAADTSRLLYHNFIHTNNVVLACKEIGEGSNVSEEELEVLTLSAWFHDVGYLTSCENHEEIGVKCALEFLTKEAYPVKNIERIVGCIMATKMGVTPETLLQEIICDADMRGLSSDAYTNRSKLLREECLFYKGEAFIGKEEEWLEKEIIFLSKHSYYTKFAVLNYTPNKLQNILARKAEFEKQKGKSGDQDKKNKLKEKELKLKIEKSEIPEKGIETMFRTALKNHMELSAIADNKANMMLSVSALVLSIVISSLASKLDKHSELIVPTIFIVLVCLVTIVLATLSTRPKITGGKFSTEDVKNRKANLLFFGNFHKMKVDDYEWGMKELMKDKDYLYGALIRDLHSLGIVLARKYQFLRLCYLIFMYGMIIAVIAFGIAALIGPSSLSL